MKIAKEGYVIIRNSFVLFTLIIGCLFYFNFNEIGYIVMIALTLKFCFILRFFRMPSRNIQKDSKSIFSPADGTIVAIERVYEDEYFKEERLQVSIFMSIWNVHANWFPVSGEIKYFRHHHGKFLLANHPKSSTKNERTTTVIESGNNEILFRQVAGYVARRIVSYVKEGEKAEQNSKFGFIKFGSRIDIFLPLDSKINVKLRDKVIGTQSLIATIE